jgi:hypothetical protein
MKRYSIGHGPIRRPAPTNRILVTHILLIQ